MLVVGRGSEGPAPLLKQQTMLLIVFIGDFGFLKTTAGDIVISRCPVFKATDNVGGSLLWH
jgi:hypothetical protein